MNWLERLLPHRCYYCKGWFWFWKQGGLRADIHDSESNKNSFHFLHLDCLRVNKPKHYRELMEAAMLPADFPQYKLEPCGHVYAMRHLTPKAPGDELWCDECQCLRKIERVSLKKQEGKGKGKGKEKFRI